MNWLIGATVLVIFAVGCAVALWWWKLVARIAPYKDEVEKARGKGISPGGSGDHGSNGGEVVVISKSGESRRSG